MRYKILNLAVALTFITSCFLFFSTAPLTSAAGNEIFVDDDFILYRDGTFQKPYESIQYAIDVAEPYDTIYVFGGNYNETLVIDKPVTLVGSISDGTSFVDYKMSHIHTVTITSDDVNISGFEFSNRDNTIRTYLNGALIYVDHVDNAIIEQNNITECKNGYGIYMKSAHNTIINSNLILNTLTGVYSESSSTDEIVFNNISYCNDSAVRFKFSNYTNIYNNTLYKDRYGIYTYECYNLNITNNTITHCLYRGVGDYSSKNNLINKNLFDTNSVDGLYLDSTDTRVRDNIFQNNTVGIKLQSTSCVIYNNSVNDSVSSGVYAMESSSGNKIYNNYLRRNLINARDEGSNTWYYDGAGNYWDDYNDVDQDYDGIGENPYQKKGVYDKYPIGEFLKPPNKPTDPNPQDEAENVGLKITLEVKVADPDREVMNVRFYRIHNTTTNETELLGTDNQVDSGDIAQTTFYLNFDTIVAWYAVANDSRLENQSDIWFFTTKLRPKDNEPPVAIANEDLTSNIGEKVSFNASTSYDNDGEIRYYRWNFGDGTSEILSVFPSHTYVNPGMYNVTLTVIDDNGASDTDYVMVNILGENSEEPVANPGGPYSGEVGKTITFDASGSTDDGEIVEYSWDFGDGTTGTGETTTHVYYSDTAYLVTLTVTDNNGQTNSKSTTADINKKSNNGSPGFEVLLFIFAIALVIYYRKRNLK